MKDQVYVDSPESIEDLNLNFKFKNKFPVHLHFPFL